jgi:hypothetical protein
MTAAGQAQAAAAQAIAPALAAFNRSFARTRNASPDDYTLIASHLHGCLGSLASAVNSTGYNASGRWRGAFLEGQAEDPDTLKRATHDAACLIQQAANLTVPIRAVRKAGTDPTRPARQAGYLAWKACLDLTDLIARHHRAQAWPQVPEYAAVLAALQAACEPLAAAVAVIAPQLAGIDPPWDSIWCEDFAGDLPAAYQDAARQCRAGGRLLLPVSARLNIDARTWRSRSRPRAAAAGGKDMSSQPSPLESGRSYLQRTPHTFVDSQRARTRGSCACGLPPGAAIHSGTGPLTTYDATYAYLCRLAAARNQLGDGPDDPVDMPATAGGRS